MRPITIAALLFAGATVAIGVFVITFAVTPAPANATDQTAASVDAVFAEWAKPGSPGCSVGVSRNGIPAYEHGYGMANIELGVAISPESIFHVASISKQFTAMSILLLAQRGLLSLDDEARQYITELPDYDSPLTLRHLLTHTSGLRDAFLLRELDEARDDTVGRPEALVSLLARQRRLNFTPGAEYQYNNGAYALLAAIVQRVSSQPLSAFADANIFKPLGMTHTHFHDDPSAIVLNRASGYHHGADGWHLALHSDLGRVVGNTGLFTTAHDLLLWEQNFTDVRVGARALLTAMQTPTALTTGETKPYGLGLEVGTHNGIREIGHSGGDPGYAAYAARYPDRGLAVAVLCNTDEGINPIAMAREVADVYLTNAAPRPRARRRAPAAATGFALSPDQLASKAGLYRDPSNEALLRVAVRGGKLMANDGAGGDAGFELIPVSASRFTVPGGTPALDFIPADTGGTKEVHVLGPQPEPRVLQAVSPVTVSESDLRALAGEYESQDLGVIYSLVATESGLTLRIPGRADIRLEPVSEDVFGGDVVGTVSFSRGARDAVTGFTIHSSGVRSLLFQRVKR